MSALVTENAPDFTANAVMGNNSFRKFKLSSLKGRYVVLFFYPMDFSFVCPSESLAFNEKYEEFKRRGCELVSISTDTEYTHFAWKSVPPNKGGIGCVRFPMVADTTKSISRDYGVLLNDAVALRGLFLIDRQGVVRHELVNDLPLGRSVDEALRILDALQFFEEHGEVCPANWHKGEKGMKPSAEGVAEYLGETFSAHP